MPNILISGVGGPTPRSIARSIKHSDIFGGSALFGTDVNPLAHGLYENQLYQDTCVVVHADAEDYWDFIENFVSSNKIIYALVHPEQEVLEWARFKKEGGHWPCKSLIPDYDLTKVLADKRSTTALLEDTEYVPNSYSFNTALLDIEELESRIAYPFWVRFPNGSSGVGSYKINKRSDLEHWLAINRTSENYIASTYLPGRNLAVKLLYYNGQLIRAASGERVNYIMAKLAPSGITGNTSFGRLLNEPKLVQCALDIMELLFARTNSNRHGFFTLDFKENAAGKPYLTEVNCRMVAFNYSFAMAGANFSEDIISLLSEDESFDRTYKMYEFDKDLIFLRDVDDTPILMKEKDLKQKNAVESNGTLKV